MIISYDVSSIEKNQHVMHPTITCMLHHCNTKYKHRPNATNILSSEYENKYPFSYSCKRSIGKSRNDNMEGHKGGRRVNEVTTHGVSWGKKEQRDVIYYLGSFLPTKR